MVQTTINPAGKPRVSRALRLAGLIALWSLGVADQCGWLPIATPPRLDWLIDIGAGIITVIALPGGMAYAALRAGRMVEREIQRRNAP